MTYVISDIHGCYDEFQKMLQKIEFSDSDTLILAGDYVDRGNKNVEMMRWIEDCPDYVFCLKGNHDVEFVENVNIMLSIDRQEELCTDYSSVEDAAILYDTVKYFFSKGKIENMSMYFDYYDGIIQMIRSGACLKDFVRWKKRIEEMGYFKEVDINARRYIIVHAGYIERVEPISERYSNRENFYLYAREDGWQYGGKEHSTIICGHTPTLLKNEFAYNNGKVFRHYDKKLDCVFYHIDCGCFMKSENSHAALACIRLEDENVFYV